MSLERWRVCSREFSTLTASLITRTTNDVQQVQQIFHMSMRMAMRHLMAIGGVLMVRAKTHPALILLGLIPVIGLVISTSSSRCAAVQDLQRRSTVSTWCSGNS